MEGGVYMHALVIEDGDVDFRLVERALGGQFTLRRASTLTAGIEIAAHGQFDLIILDLTLDDSRGYETFEKAKASLSDIPILIVSGLEDEELAIRAVANGAQDYVSKSHLLNYPLDRTARYAIERQRAQDAARKSEQQYRTLLGNLPIAAFTCDPQGLITYFNEKAVELWGRTPKLNDPTDRYSGSLKLFAADGAPLPHDQSWMARALRERRGFNGCEIVIEHPNGERRTVLSHANPVLDDNGHLRGGINLFVDISTQRRNEHELLESEQFAK
jgi:DNA-binding response OmpR family regulator